MNLSQSNLLKIFIVVFVLFLAAATTLFIFAWIHVGEIQGLPLCDACQELTGQTCRMESNMAEFNRSIDSIFNETLLENALISTGAHVPREIE